MTALPIKDTHLHIRDIDRLRHFVFAGRPLFGRNYRVEDYQRGSSALEIEVMEYVECQADFTTAAGQYIEEIECVEESARRDPRIKG